MTPGERKKRDLILINRALETGDPAAYSELMRHYRDRFEKEFRHSDHTHDN